MQSKSLKKNLILNYIRTFTTIVFPLITYPYAYRKLLTEGMGIVKFVTSVMVYLQLIATLGISNYAIREGAKYRDNKEKISSFASEMLIINLISTIVAYLCLFIILFIPKVKVYKTELLVYSMVLILSVIGIDWVYSIYEDFFYITIRAIFFQVLSLVLLFVLVKDNGDVNKYLMITVISTAGSSIFNLIHSRKYIKWFPRNKYSIVTHLKPILIMFGMTLATKVYLNMDSIMITMIKGDHYTGLYGSAIQINTALSVAITAISGVTLPRLSVYIGNNQWDEFIKLVKKSMHYLVFATVPTIAGLVMVSRQFILLYSGKPFIDAAVTMKIILPNLFCSIMNGFIAYQIFMPLKKEKWALYGTLIGAGVNFVLNSILIPLFAQNGAAIATVITEMTIFIFFIFKGKKIIDFGSIYSGIWKYFVSACVYPLLYFVIILLFDFNNIIVLLLEIVIGTLLYFGALYILHCEFFVEVLKTVRNMWRNKKIG